MEYARGLCTEDDEPGWGGEGRGGRLVSSTVNCNQRRVVSYARSKTHNDGTGPGKQCKLLIKYITDNN